MTTALAILKGEMRSCNACALSLERLNTVFGEGHQSAGVFILGEGPGAEEDKSGRPFVGACGAYLDKALAEVGLAREQVYLCNAVGCRPPHNRVPTPAEIASCRQFVLAQVELVDPRVVVAMGLTACKAIGVDPYRGAVLEWNSRLVIPTWHPSYVIRGYSGDDRRKKATEEFKDALRLAAAAR